MVNWISNDIISFLVALLLAGIIIPQILLIAFRKNLFDDVDERKVHKGVVPRLGGIAFFPSILFSIAVVAGFNLKLYGDHCATDFAATMMPIYFMICAVLLMFLVGIADDLVGVKYRAKFVVQILASILIIVSGVSVTDLYGFVWLHRLPEMIGWIVTSFLVVYVVNAINLIDGIDGLASGLSTVAFLFYAVVFYLNGEYVYSMLASASVGTLLPFFYYNVFGNPRRRKKIFMGDTGALTTGMIMAFCTITVLNVGVTGNVMHFNPVIIAFSPLIIPCFDVVRVYLHRVKLHRNPFLPDKCHIHHKLLALGMSQSVALCVIMACAVAFVVVNLLLSRHCNPTIIILLDSLVWTLVNVLLTRAIKRRERRMGKKLFD